KAAVILVIFLLGLHSCAQKTRIPYTPLPENEKFAGTWVFSTDTAKFMLELKFYQKFYYERIGRYTDILKGSIQYTKGGLLVYKDEKLIGRTGPQMAFILP